MMNIGTRDIQGGFYGTKMLTGYVLHGPDTLPLASGLFDDLSIVDPPETTTTTEEPVEIVIGTINFDGDFDVSVGDTVTYSVSNDGNATNLSYLWSITGGTGSSTSDSIEVNWVTAGTGEISCTITSSNPSVTDSPKSGSTFVNVNAVTTLPNAPTNVSIVAEDTTVSTLPSEPTNVSILAEDIP